MEFALIMLLYVSPQSTVPLDTGLRYETIEQCKKVRSEQDNLAQIRNDAFRCVPVAKNHYIFGQPASS
ncbi:MAG: hypothetical protein EBT20_03845 [Alphaproteobacteria bacterium]|nr:hypothetical protein [Alphaproteobacteria bacterium]